ncbi:MULTISPECIES: RidA family protein [Dyella]|uniref:RidA family protein n=2 Tax=Dyella TaxID=231454 RepID=A0A4R0YUL3_9GAMM|nr:MULTISPECIES: RidA family protein [Dyella]TBR39299.1 RidA family protein [Dyella terrae]TCI13113.1 RidA family protein [Dyella soli]
MHVAARSIAFLACVTAACAPAQASDARHLNPSGMPKTNGYSHVVNVPEARHVIYVSGQLGIDANGKLAPDFRSEATQAFENVRKALAAAGADFKDVVRLNIYVTNMDAQMITLREVRNRYIDMANPPASTALEIKRLVVPTANVEIEVTAVLPDRS